MQTLFLTDDSFAALEHQLRCLVANPRIQAVLLMIPAENQYPREDLNALLQSLSKPVFGGFFPRVLWNQEQHEKGCVLLALSCEVQLTILDEQQLAGSRLEAALPDILSMEGGHKATLFAFVDGLSSHIGKLMGALFNQYGLELNYIGGGCGNSTFSPMSCVITPRGVLQGAAVLVMASCHSGIGVAHGWQSISGAFKVTQSDGNRIISLDWRPAFEVYQQIVEGHSGTCFTEQNYAGLAKSYPFGIAMLGAEMVIRDPVQRVDNSLICVGDVRQGAYVHVMHGETSKLIEAARQARERAIISFGSEKPKTMIFVNCVSRSMFLGADASRELTAVQYEGIPLVGALTVGEIANSGDDYLELYNKTSVVGLI